mmetsp:Transcript_23812/g.72886  ORF Transcript_23812/g.72886 Transcript_23812/m.72886 type:complete len:104 (-) Transcript_23812:268-579(-)
MLMALWVNPSGAMNQFCPPHLMALVHFEHRALRNETILLNPSIIHPSTSSYDGNGHAVCMFYDIQRTHSRHVVGPLFLATHVLRDRPVFAAMSAQKTSLKHAA